MLKFRFKTICIFVSITLTILLFSCKSVANKSSVENDALNLSSDSSGFVLLSDAVPDAILEIRYYSTYNFVGKRIAGYDEPYKDIYFNFPISKSSLKK